MTLDSAAEGCQPTSAVSKAQEAGAGAAMAVTGVELVATGFAARAAWRVAKELT